MKSISYAEFSLCSHHPPCRQICTHFFYIHFPNEIFFSFTMENHTLEKFPKDFFIQFVNFILSLFRNKYKFISLCNRVAFAAFSISIDTNAVSAHRVSTNLIYVYYVRNKVKVENMYNFANISISWLSVFTYSTRF